MNEPACFFEESGRNSQPPGEGAGLQRISSLWIRDIPLRKHPGDAAWTGRPAVRSRKTFGCLK